MLRILMCIVCYTTAVYASGELTILHKTDTVLFKGHERLDESDLKELFSAVLGFSVESSSSWTGLYLTSPFRLPEAVVTVVIDGIADLGITKGHSYPLKTNINDDEIVYDLQRRIVSRNPNGNSKIVNIDLSDGLSGISNYDFFSDIKHIKKVKGSYSYLKSSTFEDQQFLQEINLLNEIISKIEMGVISEDHQPDYYRIKCSGLHAVSDLHGENSTATKEAKQLLLDAINRLSDAFKKVYNGNVLVCVVTSDVSHTRRARSITQNEPKPIKDEKKLPDINLAKTYNTNYPVMFNIILWFGVIMVFALLAISITIGSMDPGRDSIIYRMTSTRLKKD